MKISTDSWHYRLIDVLDFDHPDNLCAYFWKVVGSALAIPLFTAFILGGIVIVLMPLWWWLLAKPVALVAVIVIGAGEIVGLTAMLREAVQERHSEEIRAGERERPTPSLFSEWISAKHRKICPLIDYE